MRGRNWSESWVGALALGALAAAGLARAQDLKPEVLLLARVKAHLREALARLPDYTCLETIQRFQKAAGNGQTIKPLDTVRLEVLYSGSRELFASPGGDQFQGDDPSAFAAGGVIGNGAFALLLKSVFLDGNAILTYRGEEDLGGRSAARYDFSLSAWLSGYTIRASGASGVVGLRGSAWVDPASLDVLRLESHADEVPAGLPVAEQSTTVNYARTRVGEEEVMLPQNGELHMLNASGLENRNAFEFTHCRLFQAESAVSFGEVVAPAKAARVPRSALGSVPTGLQITVALTVPITEKDAVGGLVEGRVAGDVAAGGMTIIPAGAVVHGRIRRLEHYRESGGYFAVGLEFTDIETAGGLLRFYADLIRVDMIPGLELTLIDARTKTSDLGLDPGNRRQMTEITGQRLSIPDLPGVGSFFFRSNHLDLPKGFKMVWSTRAPGK